MFKWNRKKEVVKELVVEKQLRPVKNHREEILKPNDKLSKFSDKELQDELTVRWENRTITNQEKYDSVAFLEKRLARAKANLTSEIIDASIT